MTERPYKSKTGKPSKGKPKTAGSSKSSSRPSRPRPPRKREEERPLPPEPRSLIPRLVVATKNTGKVMEIITMLEGVVLRIAGPELMTNIDAPSEDARTFTANARKKALHYSRSLRHDYVLADDSGLEIDALDGQPGVRSARLGGPSASDMDRVRLILSRMEKVPWEQRDARFKCVVAIAKNGTLLATFEGEVEGKIAFEPSGSAGFGYDPIFFFPPMHRTFADLEPVEKNSVSHRHQAMTQAIAWLKEKFSTP
jgi:XTP/dITP diphosphohydrolase